ncbi:penicillin-binding protein activator [Nitrospirillum viridazoti]|uniref:Penicillin-binding protein activator n=1 Tax=Nitrospirillum viridazoti CBAmc TaxID=1441467 RepID=A0A248JLQ7_9PROT|nr:penicillin-binding protein activator [Nitrospirillum amazonense]ASG19471.1 penicillin-binding protein activator [Nitrospirillum amazonense CBAmc]
MSATTAAARTAATLLTLALLAGALLAGCASQPTVTAPPRAAQAPQQSPQQATGPQAAQPQPETAPAQAEAAPAPATVPADETVRVALLLPLSGKAASLGEAMQQAAQMALFDTADSHFQLLIRDTKSTPEGALAAAQDALAAGATLLIGPVYGVDAKAVAPAAGTVPVLSFSNDATVADTHAPAGGTWVLGFQPQDQVARVVSYAASRGLTRLALLAPVGSNGDMVEQAMRDAAAKAGADVTRAARYQPTQKDVSDTIKRLSNFEQRHAQMAAARETAAAAKEGGKDGKPMAAVEDLSFQAILIAEGGQRLKEVAPLLPFFDIDPGPVRFLGTGQWDEPGIGREPALVGGWYASAAPDARQGFEKRFNDVYGQRPPRLATLAYDATALAAVLAKGHKAYVRENLTDPNGFAGIDGVFRLLPTGQVERGLSVLEVTKTGVTVVDPAPTSFTPVTAPAPSPNTGS